MVCGTEQPERLPFESLVAFAQLLGHGEWQLLSLGPGALGSGELGCGIRQDAGDGLWGCCGALDHPPSLGAGLGAVLVGKGAGGSVTLPVLALGFLCLCVHHQSPRYPRCPLLPSPKPAVAVALTTHLSPCTPPYFSLFSLQFLHLHGGFFTWMCSRGAAENPLH